MEAPLNNIGANYQKINKYDSAKYYHEKSLNIRLKISDSIGICHSYKNLGWVYLETNKIDSSIYYANMAYDISKRLRPVDQRKTTELLYKIYNTLNDNQNELKYYKLFIEMKDCVSNEKMIEKSITQELNYEFDLITQRDSINRLKLIEVSDLKLKKQEAQIYYEKTIQKVLYLLVALVLITVFFVYKRYKSAKSQNVLIQMQKKTVEEQKQHIEEVHKEITDSINYAERIQRSFLATKELLDENLNEYFVLFQPKDVVSGDFYWARKLNNGSFAIVNADSTGHGVPGAIMSILNISAIEESIKEGILAPNEIFNRTREIIIERLKNDGSTVGGKDGMDATLVCFDFKEYKITYTAAQNPIWIVRDEELIEIKPEKMPVGKHDKDNISFIGGEFDLKSGDIVYTLTDGFQDQFGGEKGKKFMVKKMRNYILSVSHLTMEEQHEKIKQTFFSWKGDLEQVDDVCVIGVKV